MALETKNYDNRPGRDLCCMAKGKHKGIRKENKVLRNEIVKLNKEVEKKNVLADKDHDYTIRNPLDQEQIYWLECRKLLIELVKALHPILPFTIKLMWLILICWLVYNGDLQWTTAFVGSSVSEYMQVIAKTFLPKES